MMYLVIAITFAMLWYRDYRAGRRIDALERRVHILERRRETLEAGDWHFSGCAAYSDPTELCDCNDN